MRCFILSLLVFASANAHSLAQNPPPLDLVVQTGHTFPVSQAIVSGDGKYFVTASSGAGTIMWETASGKKLRSFENPMAVAFSGNGKVLATGYTGVELWDVVTGQKLRTLSLDGVPLGSDNTTTSLSLSDDGKFLAASESYHRQATLWETTGGKKLKTFIGEKENRENTPHVALSGDGTLLLSGPKWGTADVWETAGGKKRLTIGQSGSTTIAGISSDGKRALTLDGLRSAAVLWDTATGMPLQEFSRERAFPTCGALSADGSMVATGYGDGSASLWRTSDGRLLDSLSGFQGLAPNPEVTSVGLSGDGKILVAGNAYGLVLVWDTATGKVLHTIPRNSGCIPLALSSDGRHLNAKTNDYIEAAYGADDIFSDSISMQWDLAGGKRLHTLSSYANAAGMWLKADGRQVVLFGPADASLWDVAAGTKRHTFEQESVDRTMAMTLSTDERLLVTGGLGATLWNVADGKALQSYRGHTGLVTALALSADNQLLATGSIDRTACLWDAASGRKVRTFRGHILGIACLALSSNGKRLVTGSYDGTAIIWETSNGQKIRMIGSPRDSNDRVTMVALSRDGRLLLTNTSTGADDSPTLGENAILWDAATGKQLQTFEGSPAALSSDGRHVWTSHLDYARMWHVASGKELCRLHTVSAGREWLATTPAGFFDGSPGAFQFVAYRMPGTLTLLDDDATLQRFHRPGMLAEIWKQP